MFKKINEKKGFTLIEVLVVVTIIGVLVAVSIPLFFGQLDKSRAAVDAANVRSAKAAAAAKLFLSNNNVFYYDSRTGEVKLTADGIRSYGKSSTDLSADNIIDDYAEGIPKDGIVVVNIDNRKISAYWKSESNEFLGINAKDWEEASANMQYGGSFTPGTILTDGKIRILVFANNDWYNGELNNMSLEEFSNGFSSRVLKIDSSTKVLSEEYLKNDFSGRKYSAGTIANYKGKYYVLKQNMSYNKWENADIGINDGNWAIIKGRG